MTTAHAMVATTVTVHLCRFAIGATGLGWLAAGDRLGVAVACGALLLTILPGRLLTQQPLRDLSKVCVALLLTAHIVLGMQMNLYESSNLYDKVMHVVGSGAIAALLLVASRAFCARESIALSLLPLAVIVFAGTLSAGTLWEIFEFAIDRTGLFFAQRGLVDTMVDLLADALGAVVVLSAFAAMSCSQPNTNL